MKASEVIGFSNEVESLKNKVRQLNNLVQYFDAQAQRYAVLIDEASDGGNISFKFGNTELIAGDQNVDCTDQAYVLAKEIVTGRIKSAQANIRKLAGEIADRDIVK